MSRAPRACQVQSSSVRRVEPCLLPLVLAPWAVAAVDPCCLPAVRASLATSTNRRIIWRCGVPRLDRTRRPIGARGAGVILPVVAVSGTVIVVVLLLFRILVGALLGCRPHLPAGVILSVIVIVLLAVLFRILIGLLPIVLPAIVLPAIVLPAIILLSFLHHRRYFRSACRCHSHCSCSAFVRTDYSWTSLRQDRSATDRRGQRQNRATRPNAELPPRGGCGNIWYGQ